MTEEPETDEQRADRLETEREHAAGNHQYCGVTCEVEMPSDMLRNFIVAKGYPGTAGALDELLRRARERAEQAEAAMERVRTLADRWDNALAPDQRYARTLRAALDQPQQPGCEHCGASASHLPTTYMKGGTVGYCHGELAPKQQPTTGIYAPDPDCETGDVRTCTTACTAHGEPTDQQPTTTEADQ